MDAQLALKSHMYICKETGVDKELLKIQSKKPKHFFNMPCDVYEDLDAEDKDNPCTRDSFVDLDKTFTLFDVCIRHEKLAKRNIGDNTFERISKKLPTERLEELDSYDFLFINDYCHRYNHQKTNS